MLRNSSDEYLHQVLNDIDVILTSVIDDYTDDHQISMLAEATQLAHDIHTELDKRKQREQNDGRKQ